MNREKRIELLKKVAKRFELEPLVGIKNRKELECRFSPDEH